MNRALAHLHCTGHCEADLACECEMAGDVAPDAERVIQPPPLLPDDVRARLLRRALVLAAVGFALLGALLGIQDPRFTP